MRKLRRFLEPLRQDVVSELVGDPETLIVDSTLLSVLHPRQVKQSGGFEGAAWVRWGSFSVYGVKLHLLCATNRVPLSYELTAANVAEIRLTEELLAEADLGEDHLVRRLFGDLAYRSEALEEALADSGILLVTERSRQGAQEAAGGDLPCESQASFRDRRNLGDHSGRSGHQDRGEDHRLHLCLPGQPSSGEATRAYQGAVGLRSSQHSSRR